MNDEAVYRTAPATPGLLKKFVSQRPNFPPKIYFIYEQCPRHGKCHCLYTIPSLGKISSPQKGCNFFAILKLWQDCKSKKKQ